MRKILLGMLIGLQIVAMAEKEKRHPATQHAKPTMEVNVPDPTPTPVEEDYRNEQRRDFFHGDMAKY